MLWKKALSIFFVFCFLSFVLASVTLKPAYAAPNVSLGATLTKVSDGSTPFPSIDPNGSNGLVATLDSASFSFDVNVNTLDAAPHSVTNVTIVATLTSTSTDVQWIKESLPAACTTKTLSVDGKTLTCVIAGPVNTGSTLNVSGSWFASSNVPNSTNVTTQFTVTATQSSAAPGVGNQPSAATSNSIDLAVVSEPGSYEVRKITTGLNCTQCFYEIVRDGSGNPIAVNMRWGIQVEVKSPTAGQVKGISTAAFGDLTLQDNLAGAPTNQLPLTTKGTLISCGGNTQSGLNNTLLPNSGDSPFVYLKVENSGSWTCTQPGGTGTNINISATGIQWAPAWFPGVTTSNSAATSLYSYNNGSLANDVYNSPAGQNNQAVVATQIITIQYPFSDIVAFDQTSGDQLVGSSFLNIIGWCNPLSNIAVSGAASGVDDSTNNTACGSVRNLTGTGGADSKQFVQYGGTGSGPEAQLGFREGSLTAGASDNYASAGQAFAIALQISNGSTSVNGISNYVGCDAIESDKYNFINHNPAALVSGATGSSSAWYSWQKLGTESGFPVIADSDVVVEFSSANSGAPWSSYSAQRTTNCDDPSLTWVSDPSTHPNGLSNVNLVRVRLLKSVAPGVTMRFYFSVQAKQSLVADTALVNFYQLKSPEIASNAWQRAGTNCNPALAAWNSTSGAYSCAARADRAYIVAPVPRIRKTDTISQSTDYAENVTPGANWTYTLKAGLSNNYDANINGVKVYDILPPGMTYVSSAITPDSIIPDCDANANFACVSNPLARTNTGYTTILWNRGDFFFDHTGTDPLIPTIDDDFFGQWQVTVNVPAMLPNGARVQNKVFIAADSGARTVTTPLPIPTTYSGGGQDLPLRGPYDDDWVTSATASAFAIEKYVLEDQAPYGDRVGEIGLNGIAKYDLGYGNLNGTARTMDAIDILPFVGDGRSPATTIDGTYSLGLVSAVVNPTLLNQIYITSASTASLNSDPQHASNTGANAVGVSGGKWACTYAQMGNTGCPTASQVTGLRFISNSIPVGQWGTIRVELQTAGNDGAEFYTNRFNARATGLALPVTSSDVTVTTKCLRLGNRIFLDTDRSGDYSLGDSGIDGVDLELVNVGGDNAVGGGDDTVIKTTTSSGGGAYNFDCFVPGNYYVRIAASERQAGGSVEGLLSSVNPALDPNDNVDEDNDHNLLTDGNVLRTNIINMSFGSEPTGEAGSHIDIDANDNLTLDLGLQKPFDVELDKRVDGNGDSTFNKSELLLTPGYAGNPDPTQFQYRIQVSAPTWADVSTGVVVQDIIRPGIRVDSVASVTQGSVSTSLPMTGAASAGSPLVWNVGSVAPGTTYTLILNVSLTAANLGTFSTGFSNGVSRNVAQVTAMNETDVDSTPNNIVSYDPTSHEDDESDATVTIPPAIGDFVWEDTDADGVQDGGENGIANVKMNLYADDDGTPGPSVGDTLVAFQYTNIDGYYLFGSLDVGVSYYVSADSSTYPQGYRVTQSFATSDSLDSNFSNSHTSDQHTLIAGEVDLTLDLGLHSRIDLGNKVFYDSNNNGVLDNGETGINGVNVQLFDAADTSFSTPLDTVVTSGDGNYLFANIDEGDYVVRIADIYGDTGIRYITSTGKVGNSGPFETAPDGDDNVNNDDNGSLNVTSVVSQAITLSYNNEPSDDGDSSTYTNLSLDFGFYTKYSVGNRVFVDEDGDGVFDIGDTGFGTPVPLIVLNSDQSEYDSDPYTAGVQTLTVNSDSNGYYQFDGLPAGQYRIGITIPTGYSSSPDNADTANAETSNNDSDRGIGGATGYTYTNIFTLGPLATEPTNDEDAATSTSDVNLPNSHRNMTIDFGVVEPFDLKLTKEVVGTGPFYATGTVEFTYTVENLGPGPVASYFSVEDQLPSGLTYQSVSSFGNAWSCIDNVTSVLCTRDSGASNLSANDTSTFTLTASIDFGVTGSLTNYAKVLPPSGSDAELIPVGTDNDGYETGDNTVDSNNDSSASLNVNSYSLGDRVFFDINNDGIQDITDWPIEGVEITITSPGPDGDFDTAGDNVVSTTTTDADGLYSFTGLAYSQYLVEVSNRDSSLTNVYDVDSNFDEASLATFSDPSVLTDYSHDFGYVASGSAGDYVWWDANGDGIQDSNETPLADVSVTLTWAGPDNDLTTTNDNQEFSTKTDSDGKYLFTGLIAGNYSMHVVAPSGTNNLTTNNQDTEFALTLGGSDLTLDFGFDDDGVIGNLVYFDRNNNGKFDGDDVGISGVELELYTDIDGDGQIETGQDPVRSVVTDSNGSYLFTNLLIDDFNSGNDGGQSNSAAYIVRVKGIQSSSRFSSYWDALRSVYGSVGVDNNGQNALGYKVLISVSNSSNLTADFGYFEENAESKLFPTEKIPPKGSLITTGRNSLVVVFVALVLLVIGFVLIRKTKIRR